MLISIFWLPKNLEAAVALARAERAENQHNYISEQAELEKAKKIVPSSIDVQAHLLIASFYNSDFKTLGETANFLENKKVEDSALFNRASYVMSQTTSYVPSEAFTKHFFSYKNSIIPDSAYEHYLKDSPGDIYALNSLASSYTKQEKYKAADSVFTRTLAVQSSFLPAMEYKTMIKRELNQLDSSLYYCNKVLAVNHQNILVISSKARTLLKMGKNSEGLNLAMDANKLDKTNPYNLATMAIAYHFNKEYKKRDALIKLAQNDSVSKETMSYAKDIISGKVKFQN
ncbi:MAG TPA: hypothetical protein VL442_11110 [Mucilaginibacter sp.]|nr:hypothetical protein [Mucilaginibacter sp.]